MRALFEFTLTTSQSDKLGISKTSNSLGANNFTLDIDKNRAAGDQVRVKYNDGTNDVVVNATLTGTAGNYKIIGNSGTVLEGMEFVYVGTGVDSIDVNATQGIGDRLYNLTDGLVADKGLISTEVTNLDDSANNLQDNINRENTRLDDYRNRLYLQFSNFEAQLSKINSTLAFLDAQTAAQNNYGR